MGCVRRLLRRCHRHSLQDRMDCLKQASRDAPYVFMSLLTSSFYLASPTKCITGCQVLSMACDPTTNALTRNDGVIQHPNCEDFHVLGSFSIGLTDRLNYSRRPK